MAGFTCPAVPPQVNRMRLSVCSMVRTSVSDGDCGARRENFSGGGRVFTVWKSGAGSAYPALVGFICRDTDSTMPISASWMERAVPP